MIEEKGPKLLKISQKQRDKYLEVITDSLMDGDPILWVSGKPMDDPEKGKEVYIQGFINGDRRIVGEALLSSLRENDDFLLVMAWVCGKELMENPRFIQAIRNAQIEIQMRKR